MALLVGLLALSSLLWGASSYLSHSSLAIAGAVAGCWLLAFAIRERVARARRRTAQEG
ncbi:presenilin-like A22 family membrane protease [Streptacidiphilus sp. MAP12-16]|uniref:hypothetical protein n=1 Tax=Streptacidiphilus sp. MAP12-16 TaxID=3156300 RepID=UPI003512D102